MSLNWHAVNKITRWMMRSYTAIPLNVRVARMGDILLKIAALHHANPQTQVCRHCYKPWPCDTYVLIARGIGIESNELPPAP